MWRTAKLETNNLKATVANQKCKVCIHAQNNLRKRGSW
jgi:hypothetical protein